MKDRPVAKWHHEAAASICDAHIAPGFLAAGITIGPEDRVKMVAALACKIAEHEPKEPGPLPLGAGVPSGPGGIELRPDWQETKPGDVVLG